MTDVRIGVHGAHLQMKDQETPRLSQTEVMAAIKALTIEEKTAITRLLDFMEGSGQNNRPRRLAP